jgi:FlaA1/EpsC-like NDP-sugar epimerase
LSHLRVLVIGAGEAGRMAVREMLEHGERGYLPVGFVDDNPQKQGAEFHGVRVLGARDAIVRLVRDENVDEILIALPSVRGPVIRDIVRTCESARVRFRIVPGIWEIIRGDVRIDQIREVEPEDLLGRESVEIDAGAVAGYLTG